MADGKCGEESATARKTRQLINLYVLYRQSTDDLYCDMYENKKEFFETFLNFGCINALLQRRYLHALDKICQQLTDYEIDVMDRSADSLGGNEHAKYLFYIYMRNILAVKDLSWTSIVQIFEITAKAVGADFKNIELVQDAINFFETAIVTEDNKTLNGWIGAKERGWDEILNGIDGNGHIKCSPTRCIDPRPVCAIPRCDNCRETFKRERTSYRQCPSCGVFWCLVDGCLYENHILERVRIHQTLMPHNPVS